MSLQSSQSVSSLVLSPWSWSIEQLLVPSGQGMGLKVGGDLTPWHTSLSV